MQKTSPTYKREMLQPIVGEAFVKITFGTIDADAATTCTSFDNGHVHWSSVFSILTQESVPSKTYATFEKGRIKVNGLQIVPPKIIDNYKSEGYVSTEMSDKDGIYLQIPFIQFEFSKTHTVPALSLVFDGSTGDYASQIKIIAKRENKIISQKVYTPSGAIWQTDEPIERFDFIELLFLSSNVPFRRARLQQIMFGFGAVFTTEIASANQKMEVDPISRRLPANTFDFALVNSDEIKGAVQNLYDPDNPKGVWKYIEQQSPITVEYGQKVLLPQTWSDLYAVTWKNAELNSWNNIKNGGTIQWIKGGRYYLTSQPTIDSLYANFTAQDMLTFMDKTYYKGVYVYSGCTLYDIALSVLEDAGLPLVFADRPPYILWEGLKLIKSAAPMPIKKHKECLQLIAHAACCVLFTDRDGCTCITPASTLKQDCLLDYRSMRSTPKVSKIATLKSVECASMTYAVENKITELHKATYILNGDTALHITYPLATEITLSISNGSITSKNLYAGAADLTVDGHGTTEIIIGGKKLVTSTSVVVVSVTNADENGSVEVLENPLITEFDTAKKVATWVKNYLLLRNTYEFDTRGTPDVDPLDIVETESQFTSSFTACILKNELNYGGGFSGKIMCKRLEN